MYESVGASFIAFFGIAVAVWGVVTQRLIARRRATLDFIARAEADKDVIEARRTFIKLANEDGGLAGFAERHKESSQEAQAIKLVLNEFELIAIGIQRGIVDLEVYKRWNRSTVLTYWKHAQPFVTLLRTRTKNEAFYHEFEQMAGWLKDNKMPKRRRFWALFF